ncbi:hypothetical protein HD806DRAFT_523967 [Xylariaceae sp. AK1471]|nr:hypothetical protein HD806DRAFT_523967 [Xylariaceae sp. AK1471]
MKYISFLFLLLPVSFAKMLVKLDIGTDPELPSCGSHCMSLFQCLYSQCDSNEYGKALSRTISTCMEVGAEIHMVAPGSINDELLHVREADYLAGRQLSEIPGLQLRQESIPFATVTATFTDHVTLTVSFSPTPTPFLTASPVTTSISRPWVITQSDSSRLKASFSGLVLWIAVVLLQDYWINGYY